jgi:ABC-2 type transport system ATP-binding protein
MFAIQLDQVSKEYPGILALDQVSFNVRKGCIHAFLGPNGAGKSTTMKIITGLLTPTSGRVEVSASVGFLPENPPLYPTMKVQDYLQFARDLKTLRGESRSQPQELGEILEKTGLQAVSNRLIGNLSKGYRQRVGIAQALVANPEIVILDEPTVGLDPQAIMEIRELILALKKDHTIMLSSHQLHEVEQICTDVTIIQKGRIVSSGSLKEIQKQFQTTQIIHAELLRFEQRWVDRLDELFGVQLLEKHSRDASTQVRLCSTVAGDQREAILKFLVTHDAGVVSFNEVVPDLEVIFKELTHQGVAHD